MSTKISVGLGLVIAVVLLGFVYMSGDEKAVPAKDDVATLSEPAAEVEPVAVAVETPSVQKSVKAPIPKAKDPVAVAEHLQKIRGDYDHLND